MEGSSAQPNPSAPHLGSALAREQARLRAFGAVGHASSPRTQLAGGHFQTLRKIPQTQVDPGAIYNQSMLARGDSWLRQQMAMDDILAAAAEIDPGLRTQPVNLDERGWQNRPATEGASSPGSNGAASGEERAAQPTGSRDVARA